MLSQMCPNGKHLPHVLTNKYLITCIWIYICRLVMLAALFFFLMDVTILIKSFGNIQIREVFFFFLTLHFPFCGVSLASTKKSFICKEKTNVAFQIIPQQKHGFITFLTSLTILRVDENVTFSEEHNSLSSSNILLPRCMALYFPVT